ncbi:hypothetical protein C6503_04685 [Candidatus Poribacteria bacterium]|nr:MAG: hypothetical protein C6503_04685 [Candidatus Poribacteria bacterium]
MKRYHWIHCYIYSIGGQQMKLKLNIPVLLVGILLSLLLVGCGTILVREGPYEAPQLPKSELATIKIDTEGQWIQRPNLIVFRIDGKLALREKIDLYEAVSIDDEILIAPGKHEMSLLVVYESFHANIPKDRQILSRFSADVKAGGTYLLTGEFSGGGSSKLNFSGKLIDTNKDKVVSKSKFFNQFTFDME